MSDHLAQGGFFDFIDLGGGWVQEISSWTAQNASICLDMILLAEAPATAEEELSGARSACIGWRWCSGNPAATHAPLRLVQIILSVQELLQAGGGPLSHGEKVTLFVAWALWNGEGELTLNEVLNTLDGGNLRMVGELLVAISAGSEAIDGWLQEYAARHY
jgi:hypothetical protein